MTAEIVNLKRARKAKARAERETVAEANRRLHGRSKAERDQEAGVKRLEEERLAGHRRDGEAAPRDREEP